MDAWSNRQIVGLLAVIATYFGTNGVASVITGVEVEETYASSKDLYPESLGYDVRLGRDVTTLRLRRMTRLSTNLPVYVLENGALVRVEKDPKQNYVSYHDESHGASIVVSAIENKEGVWERTLRGTFLSKGHHVSISHHEDFTSTDTPGTYHAEIITSYTPLDMTEKVARGFDETLLRRLKRSATTDQHFVQLLLMVDYSLYQRFYNQTNGSSPTEREKQTIPMMERYYAQVANGINLRYRNLKEQSLKIEVVLSAIYIAKTAEESYWTESADVKNVVDGQTVINATRAMEYILQWSTDPKITASLPTFDHAMLLTGYNIWRGYTNGKKNTGVAGSAVTGGMCTSESYSINEDPGAFKTIDTCTHELGHSLGAVHDGSGNGCDSNDQYIMAVTESATDISTYKNRYLFSSCSVSSMTALINKLNNENKNCMLNSATNLNNETYFQYLTSVMPGQMLSVHEQCRDMYGSESYYCGGTTQEKVLCREMQCYNPKTKACEQYSGLRAARGTTCGDRKWCIEGDCVCGYDAPRAPATCTHGDYPAKIYSNQNYKCQDAAKDPSLCYQEYFRDKCCKSCPEQYDACALEDCRYGNLNPTCSTYKYANVCPDSSNWAACCKLCETDIVASRGVDMAAITACRNQTKVVDDSYECENITTTIPPSTTTGPSTTQLPTTKVPTTTTAPPTTTTAPPSTTTTTTSATTTRPLTTTTTAPETTLALLPTATPYDGTLFYTRTSVRWDVINNQAATFTQELKDSTSTQYKQMETEVCALVKAGFGSSQPIKTCSAKGFRSGSIVSDLDLGFSESVSPSTVESAMKQPSFFPKGSTATTLSVSDVNECSDKATNDCSAYSACNNTGGGYTCTCLTGYDDTSIGNDKGRRCSLPCNTTSCSGSTSGICRPSFDGPYGCLCNPGFSGVHCESNLNAPKEMEFWRIIIIAVAMGLLAIYLAIAIPYMIYQMHKYRNTDKSDAYRRALQRQDSKSTSSTVVGRRSRSKHSDSRNPSQYIPSQYIPRLNRDGPSKPNTSRTARANAGFVMDASSDQRLQIPRPEVRSSADRSTLTGFSI